MTDTELLDFCDECFARDAHRREKTFIDVAIGDVSVVIQPTGKKVTFRDVIQRAADQRIRAITRRLTK